MGWCTSQMSECTFVLSDALEARVGRRGAPCGEEPCLATSALQTCARCDLQGTSMKKER